MQYLSSPPVHIVLLQNQLPRVQDLKNDKLTAYSVLNTTASILKISATILINMHNLRNMGTSLGGNLQYN